MSSFAAIEQRLRAARPGNDVQPPPFDTVLSAIEADAGGRPVAARAALVAAHPDHRSGDRGRRRPRRRRWGSAAVAGRRTRCRPPTSCPRTPKRGSAQPEAASLTPLPMRVADPEGGPPWAMRVIRTTRGLVCMQGGRLVNGQLGGLGSGYAFGADGRFHPFEAEDAIATDACPAVGAGRPAFLPGPPMIVTANALPLAGENVAPGGPRPVRPPRRGQLGRALPAVGTSPGGDGAARTGRRARSPSMPPGRPPPSSRTAPTAPT